MEAFVRKEAEVKRITVLSFALAAFASVSLASQASASENGTGKDVSTGIQVSYLDKATYTNFQRFVSALEDTRENASQDNDESAGGSARDKKESDEGPAPAAQVSYRNIHSQESIFAALEDSYNPERYPAVMERSRFSALEADCVHTDADFLGDSAHSYAASCK